MVFPLAFLDTYSVSGQTFRSRDQTCRTSEVISSMRSICRRVGSSTRCNRYTCRRENPGDEFGVQVCSVPMTFPTHAFFFRVALPISARIHLRSVVCNFGTVSVAHRTSEPMSYPKILPSFYLHIKCIVAFSQARNIQLLVFLTKGSEETAADLGHAALLNRAALMYLCGYVA